MRRVSVVGTSGSGKSTLARALAASAYQAGGGAAVLVRRGSRPLMHEQILVSAFRRTSQVRLKPDATRGITLRARKLAGLLR
jgi:ABC-type glutathione transport system ATPase component